MPSARHPAMSTAEKSPSEGDEDAMARVMGFASFGKARKTPGPSAGSANKAKKASPSTTNSLSTKVASTGAAAAEEPSKLPTDYMKMFEESLRLARERNQTQGRAAVIGPTLPPESVTADAETSVSNSEVNPDKASKKEKKKKKEKKHKKDKKKDISRDRDAQSGDAGDEEVIGPPIPDCFKTIVAATSTSDSAATTEAVQPTSRIGDSKVRQEGDSPDGDDNKHGVNDDNEDDEEEEGDDEVEAAEEEASNDDTGLFVPRSSQISLDHRTGKPVVALGVDASGSRLVSGGSDFSLRYWNFAGMDSACRPFKTLDQPCGAHQIRYAGFNCTSDCVLVASGSAQLRLYNREGKLLSESVKGYQYISNPRSTPGHTHALLGAAWHPRDGAEFMTCSMDNSMRLWDPNNTEAIMQETRLKSCKEVIVPKSAQGRAVTPTACAYTPDGNLVFGGCSDGSIQAWDRRRRFVNNCHLLHNAHGADTVTCLAFSYDSQCLLSRSMDDTLKLWDLRQFAMPLFIKANLSTQYEQTTCGFAPNDRLFFTATSAPAKICAKDGRSPGQLLFFDRSAISSASASASTAEADALTCNFDAGVIRCVWHAKINQLLLSTADGRVCVLFDQQRSVNGARLCAAKPAKRSLDSDQLAYRGGFVRETLLTFDEQTMREVRQGKRKTKFYEHEAANQGPRRVYQAEAPLSGPGYGGKLGPKGGSLHQYMLQQMVPRRDADPAEKDIRSAILRHNDAAVKNPMWTTAYAKTQPKPIFQEAEQGKASSSAQDDSADPAKKRRIL